ncbi:potassium transporter Kup [Methylolobus aquaticus]|nr:potassium transporter Kup [Methylolobus aquaticus]
MKSDKDKPQRLITTIVGAIGVVYGDIGTSPLYTMKLMFSGPLATDPSPSNVMGALSLIFWALTMVISIKYVLFIMRADNRGEGGIMALMALALHRRHRRSHRAWIMGIGLFGTALFYGDGLITPAISVLSAVEGLEIGTPRLHPFIQPIAVGVLLALFSIQRYGTSRVGILFGPIMVLWFLAIGYLGFRSLIQNPEVLEALNPLYAVQFFQNQGWQGFFILGAVVLALTGGEALYADMGHFGLASIRWSWYLFVLPALLINYLGQGALLLRNPEAMQNPFYLLVPEGALYPMVALATLATIIASQAVISGAFSITRQAIQLDYLPRQRMIHTSESEIGQIFVPAVNRVLMFGVVGLVLFFGSSAELAAAYGIAVTGAMAIDTMLAFIVAIDSWKWPIRWATAVMGTFLFIDLSFFAANIPKIPEGGWFPLLLGSASFLTMTTWKRGREVLQHRLQRESVSLGAFLEQIATYPPIRVPGTAIFLNSRHLSLPFALLQNFEHNHILHERIILLTVIFEDIPFVSEKDRLMVENLEQNFFRVTAKFGFMQVPHVPRALALCPLAGLAINLDEATFFLGRETVIPTRDRELNRYQEKLFISLYRNAASPLQFFRLPPRRVIELGSVIEV